MIAIAMVLAVLVGITLGLLGGGGSILMVPLLAYVAGLEPTQAIATSLFVVGATSAAGAVSHALAGRVQWRTGLSFGSAGMVGAYAGGSLAAFAPAPILLVGFAAMMITAAVAMLRGRRESERVGEVHRIAVVLVAINGLVVGLITGLVGAGGGFLVVPALALLGGLPMPVAVGSSLVVIAMNSFAGLAGHLSSVHLDWRLAAAVTLAALMGGVIGARLTAMVNPDFLRRVFGWFVLAMASVILAQEVHPVVGIASAALTVVVGVIVVVRTGIARRLAGLAHRATPSTS